MENKKTKVAIIIVIMLIVGLIIISLLYNNFNTNQTTLLTQEANKILEADLVKNDIDMVIKTEKNYAKVETAIKEYISKLKNIYGEMKEIISSVNPNSIFSAQNIQEDNIIETENIINEYKEKSQNLISDYEKLITEEKILESIEQQDFSIRKDYYIGLYNNIMLSDTMENQYNKIDEEIKNEKAKLYEKLNKIEKLETFLEENGDSWTIKDDKIQFTNLNRMTEYYNLLNQIID